MSNLKYIYINLKQVRFFFITTADNFAKKHTRLRHFTEIQT